MHAAADYTLERTALQSSAVDALLAFAAALVALRLSGELVRRYPLERARRATRPGPPRSRAYALAAGALAWGAAAGWSDAAFRVYYLGGALLTAALLGAGSLLLVGTPLDRPGGARVRGPRSRGRPRGPARRRRSPGPTCRRRRTCSTCGPHASSRSRRTPWGRSPSSVVALARFRRRPLGNALILAGVAVAALGSGLAGLGVGALAPALAVAALLLYAGFVVPTARRP